MEWVDFTCDMIKRTRLLKMWYEGGEKKQGEIIKHARQPEKWDKTKVWYDQTGEIKLKHYSKGDTILNVTLRAMYHKCKWGKINRIITALAFFFFFPLETSWNM